MLTGFAFATLLLNTAAAIVVYFAYSFLVPTIFAIAAEFLDWFKDVQPWVDFTQTQQPLIDASMTGKDWAQLLVAGFIWLVIPVVARVCGGSCAPRSSSRRRPVSGRR